MEVKSDNRDREALLQEIEQHIEDKVALRNKAQELTTEVKRL